MKRYFVFAFPKYYPSGGLDDMTGNAETLEDALIMYDQAMAEGRDYCYVYFLNDAGDFEVIEKYETDLYA